MSRLCIDETFDGLQLLTINFRLRLETGQYNECNISVVWQIFWLMCILCQCISLNFHHRGNFDLDCGSVHMNNNRKLLGREWVVFQLIHGLMHSTVCLSGRVVLDVPHLSPFCWYLVAVAGAGIPCTVCVKTQPVSDTHHVVIRTSKRQQTFRRNFLYGQWGDNSY